MTPVRGVLILSLISHIIQPKVSDQNEFTIIIIIGVCVQHLLLNNLVRVVFISQNGTEQPRIIPEEYNYQNASFLCVCVHALALTNAFTAVQCYVLEK